MDNQNHSAPRVAVIGGAPEASRWHNETLGQMRRSGVSGYRVDVIEDAGPGVDLDPPGYDLIHICQADPAGTVVIGRAGAIRLGLSPSRAADRALAAAGFTDQQIHRWRPGVDRGCFTPAAYDPDVIPRADGTLSLLYAGPVSLDDGLALLIEACLMANRLDPRLRLVVAGEGPDLAHAYAMLGPMASFVAPRSPDHLARVYASADLLVFPSSNDLLGQAIPEAQASGLPVLAVDGGAAPDLIESGRSGCLVEPSAPAVAEAIIGLTRRATLRERLATGGLTAVRTSTWEQSLAGLGAAWAAALDGAPVRAHATPPLELVARAA